MKDSEIYDLASRYVDEEDFVTIPQEGEIFALLQRKLPDNKVLKEDEGWQFGGYAQCKSIEIDYSAKPEGKWLFFTYLSLASFPPQEVQLRLQPPHVALGLFRDPTKTIETKIITLNLDDEPFEDEDESDSNGPTILSFPGKK